MLEFDLAFNGCWINLLLFYWLSTFNETKEVYAADEQWILRHI